MPSPVFNCFVYSEANNREMDGRQLRASAALARVSASPVEMHSLCRLVMSLRRLPFMASGPAHTTSDTVALVLFSHVISHFARQSHSKALPRRSLGRRSQVRRYGHRAGSENVPLFCYLYIQPLAAFVRSDLQRVQIQVILSVTSVGGGGGGVKHLAHGRLHEG